MLNVVAIMGRLAADPQMRQTQAGKSVCSFRIACDRGRKDANGQNQTDWLDVVAWDKTADFVSRHFSKGSMIAVTGRLQSRNYQDKNGNNRTAIEIVANQVSFCGEKKQETKPFPPANENALNLAQGGNDDFAPVDDADDLPF